MAQIIPLLGGVRGGSLGREISVNISRITDLPTPLPRGDFLTRLFCIRIKGNSSPQRCKVHKDIIFWKVHAENFWKTLWFYCRRDSFFEVFYHFYCFFFAPFAPLRWAELLRLKICKNRLKSSCVSRYSCSLFFFFLPKNFTPGLYILLPMETPAGIWRQGKNPR